MRHRLLLSALAALLTLGACSSSEPTAEAPTQTATTDGAAAFPRTVEVPAGRELPADEVTLEAEPERVAALTYEAAAVVAELGAVDRPGMVPEEAGTRRPSEQRQEVG